VDGSNPRDRHDFTTLEITIRREWCAGAATADHVTPRGCGADERPHQIVKRYYSMFGVIKK